MGVCFYEKNHHHPEAGTKDLQRQQEIEIYGAEFLRFENKEVKYNVDDVTQTIEDWIKLNE